MLGDENGVLPLCGQTMVFGHRCPAIAQHFHVAFADVDHGLDGENHAGFDEFAGATFAKMHHVWFFMEFRADAVTAKFSHDRIAMTFRMFLNRVADVAKMCAGFDLLDAEKQALARDFDQTFGVRADVADAEHFAGVAMITVLDDGNVDIDDVAVFQFLVAGNAVTDLMVHRGADRFRETAIIQRCRNGVLYIDDVVMAKAVEFIGGDADRDMRRDHVQNFGGQPTGDAHFFDFGGGFDYDTAHLI